MNRLKCFKEDQTRWPYRLEYVEIDGSLWDQHVLWAIEFLGQPGADDDDTKWTYTGVRDFSNLMSARVWFRSQDDAVLFDLVFLR